MAIDGPAGSGKSTTARAVAAALGYAHLDSGALYRAVTLLALEAGQGPPGWRGAVLASIARDRQITMRPCAGGGLGDAWEVAIAGRAAGPELRSEAVTRHVSEVSAMPQVRDFVNGILRQAGAGGGVVMDGRDIGTVVFPDAEVKVFLVAASPERARRRLLERGQAADPRTLAAEEAALLRRDALDRSRATAPLARAPDAVTLDTTGLAFEEQVAAIVALARSRAGGGPV